jgi:hypothetical protein
MNAPEARRGFLKSACRHCLGCGALLSGLPSLAQDAAPSSGFKVPGRFSRPAVDTDEGGLWSLMDREEARLRRSPLAIRDPALSKYLSGLTCRLTEGHCLDIRIHVMRTPIFNASMAPNGMMQVWSGLLLRVENEAQLAAIVGHELGHYLERHQVEQLRDAKDKAMLAQLVGLIGGIAGAVGKVGILATQFAFSREHETRADRLGMRLMKDAGYEGRQAARVWDNLLGELKVTGGENGRRRPGRQRQAGGQRIGRLEQGHRSLGRRPLRHVDPGRHSPGPLAAVGRRQVGQGAGRDAHGAVPRAGRKGRALSDLHRRLAA